MEILKKRKRMEVLNKCVQTGMIAKINLRHHFILPFLSAAGILFVTALLFPITALEGKEAAKPIEFLLPFVGAALLTLIFLPEQDSGIRDVIESKKLNCSVIYAVRLFYSVLVMTVLVAFFIGIMYLNECEIHWFHLYGGIASAFFLGSTGFAAAGISKNTVMGYMAVAVYYLACYGLKKQLGVFWLFRMSAGIENGKTWLFAGGTAMIAATFGIQAWRRKFH